MLLLELGVRVRVILRFREAYNKRLGGYEKIMVRNVWTPNFCGTFGAACSRSGARFSKNLSKNPKFCVSFS